MHRTLLKLGSVRRGGESVAKRRLYTVATVIAVGLTIQACTSQPSRPADASRPAPWTYNAARAEGYSIDLVSVQPSPGTKLNAGSVETFRVKVKYSMSVAERGRISFVFQLGRRMVPGTYPPATQNVEHAAGIVELSQTVTIPSQGDELTLYVPLTPEGMTRTDGEVVIRYPVLGTHPETSQGIFLEALVPKTACDVRRSLAQSPDHFLMAVTERTADSKCAEGQCLDYWSVRRVIAYRGLGDNSNAPTRIEQPRFPDPAHRDVPVGQVALGMYLPSGGDNVYFPVFVTFATSLDLEELYAKASAMALDPSISLDCSKSDVRGPNSPALQ
jgi:hypothetical protein